MRLIVFARAPAPGLVKRRLIPALGSAGAAALYRRLARTCLMHAIHAAPGEVELWCAPDVRHPFFDACRRELALTLHRQRGEDLGERMAAALRRGLPALLMGSDCPDLLPSDLQEAAAALAQGCDAVLGPALDGGYVLVGLSRYDALLFRDIPWGTDQVLEHTRARLHQLGWRWHELTPRADIDRPEDLHRLL
jgi:uncharacterized protein